MLKKGKEKKIQHNFFKINFWKRCVTPKKALEITWLFSFSGQEEIRYPNGTLQISFADGSVKRIDTDGTENINFPDGTKVIVKANGERTLLLPTGQKEIHTTTFKVRSISDKRKLSYF